MNIRLETSTILEYELLSRFQCNKTWHPKIRAKFGTKLMDLKIEFVLTKTIFETLPNCEITVQIATKLDKWNSIKR